MPKKRRIGFMYWTLSSHDLLKVVRREFELRFKGIEIPALEIAFSPKNNRISIYVRRDELTDSFAERLEMHKLLLKADQLYVFINSDLLMKLFFSSYRVNHDSVDFFDVSEFGLLEYVISISHDGKPLNISITAGNAMHAYLKALSMPILGHFVSDTDLSIIMPI